jgi:hypothetical protein
MEKTPFFLRDDKVPLDPKLVFVILPFEKTIVFEKIIKPVVEGLDFRLICKKADDLFTTGAVMQDIADSLRKSSVVVADLSGRNPNVFYELGLAHAFRKSVVLLTRSDDDVPSDLKAHRYYRYSLDTTEGIRQFESTLKSIFSTELESSLIVAESLRSVAVSYKKGNEMRIDSSFLTQAEGTFAIWGLVDDVHDQLYPSKSNMYVVAYTTSKGGLEITEVIEQTAGIGETPTKKAIKYYPNVFSIRRNPKRTADDPGAWVFWYNANSDTYQYISSRETLSKGWHLFTVMWSRQHDFIKFHIDTQHIGTRPFLNWPEGTSGQVFIGTWPSAYQGHWFDSSLGPWRIYRNAIEFDELEK